MKKIVDGKLYDTESAELLVEFGRSALYRTSKGNFFLVSQPLGEPRMVTPTTEEELLEHLEDAVDADVLLKMFPSKIEEA